ncbi:hypothetical protein GCM10010295_53770 [Streptomyces intermedius]
MPAKSRTAPTAPGTRPQALGFARTGRYPLRPTGRKPEYVQYESFRPACREHAPDTADTAQDFTDTP